MFIFYKHVFMRLCVNLILICERLISYYAVKPNHDESDSWIHILACSVCYLSWKGTSFFSQLITREPNRQTEHVTCFMPHIL